MEFLSDINIPSWLCILAGLVYVLNKKRLYGIEKIILVVICLNIVSDLIAANLRSQNLHNGYVYNMLAPIERIITLMIYALNANNRRDKILNYTGIGLVIFMSIIGVIIYADHRDFHYSTYVVSGLFIAVFSYIQLRTIALNKAGQSILLSVFSLANLLYYTLMVSSLSALPLAMSISNDFGQFIGLGNLIAYSLWSIILIIGILWKRRTV